MATQATVTAADIARLAGVGRAAVSNWRRRYGDFPQPVGGTANSPLFHLAEVQRWLRDQGKLHRASPWESLWQLIEAHRGDHEPAENLAAIGDFLLYLDRAGADGWRQLREQPDAALAGWTVGLDADRAHLFRDIAELAAEHGAAATFTGLWERFVQANTRWITVTQPELATLMADIAGVEHGALLDPACGGGTLLAAALGPDVRGLGQEIDPGLARLAAVRLALLGGAARVNVGDSLLADAYQGLLFEAVLCDPPFNERQWGHDALVYDTRWEYGIPPRMESELAWVQHALAHVRPGGIVVMCMPPSAASRRSGRRIRAELLRRGALRSVIALPAALAPVHLWVLRRDEPGTRRLLVVDANRPDWGPTGELVRTAWRDFTDPARTLDERPGEVRAVPVLDLLGEDVDLTPARNLPVSAAPDTPEQLRARHRELAARLTELIARLPVLDGLPAGARLVVTTVAELVGSGAVSLHPSTAADPGPAEYGEPTTPLLDVDDLIAGRPPTRRVTTGFAQTCVHARPGDVIVPMVGRRLIARVATAGVALGRGLCVLRPNAVALDPWFLAGFLSGSMNTRQASTHLSSAARLDVRRCEIPRLPLREQRRYAAVFRQLAEFDAVLTTVTGLAREVVLATTDGLADGIIAPSMH